MESNVSTHWEKSYCPYCGVGCGLLAKVQAGAVTRIKGDPDHPSSRGDLCLKAVYLPETLKTSDRLLYPHIRACQDGDFKRASWGQTMNYLARRFRAIIDEHGPEAVAFYGSGQLTTEEYYVANKLAKGFLGTNNFDTNSRLCMASAAFGYKVSFGSDGPPASYADIDCADCFLLIGTNAADCHPVIFKRIKQRKLAEPEKVTIIAVDPRRTETADFADLHLPIRPGSDIALLNAMLAVLIEQNLTDGEFIAGHTRGFRELMETVKQYPPRRAAEICGVAECLIVEAALIFAMSKSALSLWSMGINQSSVGVHKNNAIHNLHLATGKIGKPGSGRFRSPASPMRWAGGKSAASRTYCRVTAAWPMRATAKWLNTFGACRAAASRRSRGLPRSNSSKRSPKANSRRSGFSAQIPRFPRRTPTSSRRRSGKQNWWSFKTPTIRPRPAASRT